MRAMALYNSWGSSGWLDALPRDVLNFVDVQHADVRDSSRTSTLTDGCDLVIHLAALVAIPYSYIAAESFVQTNVIGTLNVLEAARSANVQKVIVASTSEVYGTPETTPILEAHPLKAQSPYAATKIAADQLAMSFSASFGLNVAIVRPFNTYGPRQSLRAVIPTVLAQMIAGKEEVSLGSLHTLRDFVFVADTVDGFVRMAVTDTAPGEVVQLGTGKAVSIADVVKLCRDITDSNASIVESAERIRPEASEVQVLLADPAKASLLLDWEPRVDLQVGLKATADWIREKPYAVDPARFYR